MVPTPILPAEPSGVAPMDVDASSGGPAKNETGTEAPIPTPTRAMLQYWSRFKVERPGSSPSASTVAPSPNTAVVPTPPAPVVLG